MTPDRYSILENVVIPLRDGVKLYARIWLPEDAQQTAVPAVLEFLPYRRRDGTAARDESTYPVFAQSGYAGVRVDLRGHGDSEGLIEDEYSPKELSDAIEAVSYTHLTLPTILLV